MNTEIILIPTTFDYKYVNQLHIELTNRCNAACPMCMRFHQSSPLIRPDLELGEISIQQFEDWFSHDFLKQVKLILFCGVHGDPCIATDTLEIVEYIVKNNPKTTILFNTNGGMRNPEWWSKLGTLLTGKPDHWVTFSIDGLEDTNHIYRRNVKWDRLMANATAFIEAGGRAHWDFLIFKHNEHQIEQARQLAIQLGFSRFILKKALGVDDGKDLHPMGVLSKDGTLDYIIEAPLEASNRNLETYGKIGGATANLFTPAEYKQQHEDKLIQKYYKKAYTSIYETLDDTNYDIENKCKIRCKSLRNENIDIFIDNYGNVLPCCYVGTHLNGNYSDDKTLQLHHEVKKYGLEKFNLNYNSIEDIIKEKHIDNVFTDSWTKESVANGKMLFCAHTCGENSSIDRIYTHDGIQELKLIP